MKLLSKRIAALAVAGALTITGGAFTGTTTASADPNYVGWYADAGGLGTMRPADWDQQVICIGSGDEIPSKADIGGPETVTNPQISYLLTKYGQSHDADQAAALSYMVKQAYDNPSDSSFTWNYTNGSRDPKAPSNASLAEIIAAGHTGVQNNIDAMKAEAASITGNFQVQPKISDESKTWEPSRGTISNLGVQSSQTWLSGTPVKVHLDGPAVFDATGSPDISLTTDGKPESLTWHATGDGDVEVSESASSLPTGITRWTGRNGFQGVVGQPQTTEQSGSAKTRVTDKWQPESTSTTSSQLVSGPTDLKDTLSITHAAPGQTLSGHDTLYGPLQTEPTASAKVPAGTPIAGTVKWSTTADKDGHATVTTDPIRVDSNAYYTWVEAGDANATAPSLGWLSSFGRVPETTLDYHPDLSSQISENKGLVTDKITDKVTVKGIQTSLGGKAITTTATPIIYGPVAPDSDFPNSPCKRVNWSKAPSSKQDPIKVTKNGTFDGGSFTPAEDQAGCWSIGYELTADWNGKHITVATEPAGDATQTTFITKPEIGTQISANRLGTDQTVIDTVHVSGTNGFEGTLHAQLLGTLEPKTAGDCTSLTSQDWDAALTSGAATVLADVTQPLHGDDNYVVSGQTGKQNGCVTWRESATWPNHPYVVTTPPGAPTESALVTAPGKPHGEPKAEPTVKIDTGRPAEQHGLADLLRLFSHRIIG